ncbi:tol-pal system protein YbgF [Methyloterricola oryzae]|uniref:tol-pal system protein YbgF n=1 Tax=Methyloterricola oryzae TaxID=1495050 RepID=UPI00069B2690|nr:tol-pal system protein YbgF [Methyloterricola oryzae]
MQLSSLPVTLALLGVAPLVLAASPDDVYTQGYQAGAYGQTLDERVATLEKRVSSNTLMDMVKRIEQLQTEMAKMRGKMEELSHEVDTLRKQQKDMYLDLDQRISPTPTPTPQPAADASPPADPAAGASYSATPRPAATPVPTPAPVGRQDSYDKAFNLLKEGKYPESVRAFKSFLAAYPTGEYSDNAIYWLGEAYYVLRDFPNSRESFRRLVREVPQSAKVPDAQLKLGYIEYDAGQWAKARDLLNEVVKQYPGSSSAKLAERRLAKMKQEGH